MGGSYDEEAKIKKKSRFRPHFIYGLYSHIFSHEFSYRQERARLMKERGNDNEILNRAHLA